MTASELYRKMDWFFSHEVKIGRKLSKREKDDLIRKWSYNDPTFTVIPDHKGNPKQILIGDVRSKVLKAKSPRFV